MGGWGGESFFFVLGFRLFLVGGESGGEGRCEEEWRSDEEWRVGMVGVRRGHGERWMGTWYTAVVRTR